MMCVVVLLIATPYHLFAEVNKTDVSALPYAIYAVDATAKPADQIVLSVRMKNVNAIATWQAVLVLPEGVTVATDSFGDPMVSLSTERTSSQRHQVSTRVLASGAIRILCGSQSNKTFTGTDGEVVTITLDVASSVPAGAYPITLKEQYLVEANETGHEQSQVVSLLTVAPEDPSRYDHNGDGKVTIEDVTLIVNYIKTHENLEITK